MVYGEDKRDNIRNSKNRIFKLGTDRVGERTSYDHVGFKACLYKDDEERVKEKICKGRRALNASAGLGIRRNGLTLKTCSLIYWTIVVPIITFGCEVWHISENDHENLLQFQRYAGRRVQRFPARSPNGSCFFGLGWLRITTFIMVKKLIFALTFLRMDLDNVVRRVFIARWEYMEGGMPGNKHECYSPTNGIMVTAKKFGVYNLLQGMVSGSLPVMSKAKWSEYVWRKAWELDDLYWESTAILNNRNDLLYKTIALPRYISWWRVSDSRPELMKMCENLSRMICHTSRLKCDDYRLKDLPMSHKTCIECSYYVKEDLKHLVMQCPRHQDIRTGMFEDLYSFCGELRTLFVDKPGEVFYWLIGKDIDDCDEAFMNAFLTISGKAINEIYVRTTRDRTGVG